MPVSAQLGGLYSRSEQLIELTRAYDRGKTSLTTLEEQLENETTDLVRLQEESGFESLTDGSFGWQDQIRPIVESLEGVTTGTRYSRWFDTNTFYKKPTATGDISLGKLEPRRFVRTDLLPNSKPWKTTLVGPYTLSELTENLHYKSREDFLSVIAKVENEIIQKLRTSGVTQFVIAEPCLVYRPYRESPMGPGEIESALEAVRRTVEGVDACFSVKTYFGDATRILRDLLSLPVEGVGFDLFETDYSQTEVETDKRLFLGIVDARESNVEDPKWIAETATRVAKHVVSDEIVFVPNSDLKFVPRKVADAKARSLAAATRLTEEND